MILKGEFYDILYFSYFPHRSAVWGNCLSARGSVCGFTYIISVFRGTIPCKRFCGRFANAAYFK